MCGGILNTDMFKPSKDKYYAMMIMNMNAKKYTLSNFYYSLIDEIDTIVDRIKNMIFIVVHLMTK
jgi:hypothetical protein